MIYCCGVERLWVVHDVNVYFVLLACDGMHQCPWILWCPRGLPMGYVLYAVREGMCLVIVWLIVGALTPGPYAVPAQGGRTKVSVVGYQTPVMVAEHREKARFPQNLG